MNQALIPAPEAQNSVMEEFDSVTREVVEASTDEMVYWAGVRPLHEQINGGVGGKPATLLYDCRLLSSLLVTAFNIHLRPRCDESV